MKSFEGILVLAPCNDIHTWGMREPIDVAFISAEGYVLKSIRALGPFKRKRCRHAAYVIERYASAQTWPQEGQRIGLAIRDAADNRVR